MTNRERLFAVLNGEPVDRVPIWLLFPYHSTGYYVDVPNLPQYKPVWDVALQNTIMLNRRNLGTPLFSDDVIIRSETIEEDGWKINRQIFEYNGRSICSEFKEKDGATEIIKIIENEDDLEFFCSLPLNTDKDKIYAEMSEQMAKYKREMTEFPEELGSMMLDLGEPIGNLYGAANLTEYPIWSITHDDLIVDFLNRNMERYRHIYQFCLENNLADIYFLVGSELASPPMVSRDTFQRWIVPFAKELISMVHSYGKKVIQHYHGQIKEILPDFLDMAPDALHTIEAPPIGNCTFTEAFDVVGDKIALIGNVQYDCFRSHTQDAMKQEVQNILEECKGKRLILSPSAGPFDADISDNMVKNYLAFIDAGVGYR
jgi:uroporphyrinogen decarboxylase-like protein